MFHGNIFPHPLARSLSYKEWEVKTRALSLRDVVWGRSLWETRKILIDNIKVLAPLYFLVSFNGFSSHSLNVALACCHFSSLSLGHLILPHGFQDHRGINRPPL